MASHMCNSCTDIKLVSFNMHGFYQGLVVVQDLINTENPDIILLQEHWLTPDNLSKFEHHVSNYYSFGSSAMTTCVQSGMLRGRPYGGVITLVKKDLRAYTQTVHCDERYVIIRVANYLIVNVYFPCVGSNDRLFICDDIVMNISVWRDRFLDCKLVIAGDFNVDLEKSNDAIANCITAFAESCCLSRLDILFPDQSVSTYVNAALGHESRIDYMLSSCAGDVTSFAVVDPDIHFSDHLPLLAVINTRSTTPAFLVSKAKTSLYRTS